MSRSSSVRAREQMSIFYQQNNSNAFMSSCQLESGSSTHLTSPKTFTSKLSPKSTYLNSNNMVSNNNMKSSTLGNNLNSSYSKMYIGGGIATKFQNTMTSSISTGNTARIASSQAFLSRNQRGNSVSKAISAAASGVNSNRSSTDNLKNKENFNNSLSKIFFNSPRYKPNTSGIEQNPQIDTPDQSHQYISVLKPSNNLSDRKRQASNENSMISGGSYMKSSQTIFTNVINNNNQNNNFKTSSNKKQPNNNYSNIKQSLVLTKNINLKESNANLNKSQQSSRSFRGNESDSKLNSSSIQNSINNQQSNQSKNINLTLNRPASTSHVERSSKLIDTTQKTFSTKKEKEERSQLTSNQSRKSLGSSGQRANSNLNLLNNNQNFANDNSSQRPSTKSRMSTDSQSFNNVSSNLSKVNQQVKSTTNFTASKKLLSSQTFQLNNTCNSPQIASDTQNQIYSTKVNNFMKQFSNQPSSKFNTTQKAIYDKNDNKEQKTNDQDINKGKDELKEYKKLQEKLSYLETKIMNIKTNIDTNYQNEVLKQSQQTQQYQQQQKSKQLQDEEYQQQEQLQQKQQQQQQPQQQQYLQQQYQEYQQQHLQQQKQQQQQIQQYQQLQYQQQQQNQQSSSEQSLAQSTQNQKQPIQSSSGLSLTQKINSISLNQNSSQQSSTLNTVRIAEQKSIANVPDSEIERDSSIFTQLSTQKPQQSQSQVINIYSQTKVEEKISDAQQQPMQVQQSSVQQPQKSSGGISSFITQVSQGQNIPFNLTKSKGETNSIKSSNSQLSIIKPSSTQNLLKKQNTNGSISNTSMNKSSQNSTIKTPKQAQIVTQQPQSTSNSNQYKSFAFKSGQSSYSQQTLSNKNVVTGSNSIQQNQNAQNNINQAQSAQNNENDTTEPQIQHLSVQSMKSLSVLNQLNGLNQSSQSPYIQPKQSQLYYASSIIKGYQSIGNNHPLQILARDHLIQTMQSIQFSKHITIPSLKQIEQKKVYFNPLKENKKTLIFDLDETLIHCNENVNIPSDVIVPILFPTGEVIEAGINIRPYAVQILQELSKIYEVVIFTASHSCYANVVLDYLDPQNQEHCVQTEDGVYVKDLRVIGNRNMSDMIIVDNAAYSFAFQIDNGLPIIPFYDNKQDLELKVYNMLEISENQYSEFMDPIELLETLYPDLIKI